MICLNLLKLLHMKILKLLEVMPHFKIGPYFSKSILLFQKFGVPKTVPLIFGNKNTDFKVW